MKIEWNKVTPYSKFLAFILFLALPVAGFYFGKWYERTTSELQIPQPASKESISELPVSPPSSQNQELTQPSPDNATSWQTYRSEAFGIQFKYPETLKEWAGGEISFNDSNLDYKFWISFLFNPRKKELSELTPGYFRFSDGLCVAVSIAELRGLRCSHVLGEMGADNRYIETFVWPPGRFTGLHFGFTVSEEKWQSNQNELSSIFDTIIGSVKLIDPPTYQFKEWQPYNNADLGINFWHPAHYEVKSELGGLRFPTDSNYISVYNTQLPQYPEFVIITVNSLDDAVEKMNLQANAPIRPEEQHQIKISKNVDGILVFRPLFGVPDNPFGEAIGIVFENNDKTFLAIPIQSANSLGPEQDTIMRRILLTLSFN